MTKLCTICGQPFKSRNQRAVACSPVCAKERKRATTQQSDYKRDIAVRLVYRIAPGLFPRGTP